MTAQPDAGDGGATLRAGMSVVVTVDTGTE